MVKFPVPFVVISQGLSIFPWTLQRNSSQETWPWNADSEVKLVPCTLSYTPEIYKNRGNRFQKPHPGPRIEFLWPKNNKFGKHGVSWKRFSWQFVEQDVETSLRRFHFWTLESTVSQPLSKMTFLIHPREMQRTELQIVNSDQSTLTIQLKYKITPCQKNKKDFHS